MGVKASAEQALQSLLQANEGKSMNSAYFCILHSYMSNFDYISSYAHSLPLALMHAIVLYTSMVFQDIHTIIVLALTFCLLLQCVPNHGAIIGCSLGSATWHREGELKLEHGFRKLSTLNIPLVSWNKMLDGDKIVVFIPYTTKRQNLRLVIMSTLYSLTKLARRYKHCNLACISIASIIMHVKFY